MPTSETGTSTESLSPLRGSRGFTLLELLVVVVIIGIVIGAVVLSIHAVGSDRQAEQEVNRLRGLLDLLHEDSLMQSRDYGVMFTETGYRFYVYDYQRLAWAEPTGDTLLAEHTLRSPLSLSLVMEDRKVVLKRDFKDQDVDNPEPQIMLLSSGEVTPFEADVYRERGGGHFSLTAELNGKLSVAQDGYASR
jgi:general secretion pathway protein H